MNLGWKLARAARRGRRFIAGQLRSRAPAREWTLLALGPQPPDTAGFVSAARDMALDLQVVHHGATALRELYEAPLALVRPDQIVAWRGHDDGEAARVLRIASGG